jgi:hypothetical protein
MAIIVARSSSIFGERDITFESKNVGTHRVEELGLGVYRFYYIYRDEDLWRQSKLFANFELQGLMCHCVVN